MRREYFLDYIDGFSNRAESRGMYHACLSSWGKIYCLNLIRQNNLQFYVGMNKFEDCLFGLNYLNLCKNIIPSSNSFYIYNQVKISKYQDKELQ